MKSVTKVPYFSSRERERQRGKKSPGTKKDAAQYRAETEMFYSLKGEVRVAREVQERGWSTVEKKATRITNIRLYREYISVTALKQNLFACIY